MFFDWLQTKSKQWFVIDKQIDERQNSAKKNDDFDVVANQMIWTFQQTCESNYRL